MWLPSPLTLTRTGSEQERKRATYSRAVKRPKSSRALAPEDRGWVPPLRIPGRGKLAGHTDERQSFLRLCFRVHATRLSRPFPTSGKSRESNNPFRESVQFQEQQI